MKIGAKISQARINGNVGALKQDLRLLKKIGLKYIEVPVNCMDVIRNGQIDKTQAGRLINLLHSFDFEYTVHCPLSLDVMDKNQPETHKAVLYSTMEFAYLLGSNIVVYHPGKFISEQQTGERYKILSAKLKNELLEKEAGVIKTIAKKYKDIDICIENMPAFVPQCFDWYAEKLDVLYNQVKNINCKNVSIALDIGHLFVSSNFYGFGFLDSIKKIKDSIGYIHIHDNFGKPSGYYENNFSEMVPLGLGDLHLPPGWGCIPVADVVNVLSSRYTGIWMLEIRGMYSDYIKKSIGVLKNVKVGPAYTQ